MRTINSRTYTNVALTGIILLLAALLIRPFVSVESAHAAGSGDGIRGQRRPTSEYGQIEIAKATRESAAASQAIAVAIGEAAKSQHEIARALVRLSDIPQ